MQTTMQKIRVIPVVLMRGGIVVQSKSFRRYQALGNPQTIVARLTNWYSDELVYLDISRGKDLEQRRLDLNYQPRDHVLAILQDISKHSFMPLTFGGGVATIEDVYARLDNGADKVAINTQAFVDPGFIERCAKEFGSQCLVVSIDAKESESGHEVMIEGGRTPTGVSPVDWARQAQEFGAGEILLNSIDRDGRGQGYDIEL
ncbi:MAG: imidazole glycerol phosphate synthase subunit HisF, partial [Bdellovibrionales bacterium]|nr:imidazole glycerol phosphate synthase subunit HisF [Bdellovibrionales bacterium]